MMIYKVNLMNSKPHLMNLTSYFMSNINSFESKFKKLSIMKKLLQFLFFFTITTCFSQAPVVNNPTLNVAADNSLNISCVINPNGTVSSYEVIYSEDAFFTPNVTHSFNVSGSLTGTSPQTVTTNILCLNSADNYYVKVRATNANGTTTSGL